MGNLLRSLILAITAALAAVSCTEVIPESGNDNPKNTAVYLKINDVSTTEQAKSAIKGSAFPTDTDVNIGIFIEGDDYSGDNFKNIKFTRLAGETEWNAESEISLEGEATVYAYYPYDSNVRSLKELTAVSSIGGDDLMWGTPVTNVSSANPEISLSMNHALALVELTFNLVNLDASMTQLSVSGEGLTSRGKLDASNGVLTPVISVGAGTVISNETLSPTDGIITADCLVVPSKSGEDAGARQKLAINCTLGGKTYNATLSGDNGVVIKQGVKSTVTLSIRGGDKLEVESVGISDWVKEGVSGKTVTAGGHTVTVTGNMDVTITHSKVSTISGDDDGTSSFSEEVRIKYDPTVFQDGKYGLDPIPTIKTCRIVHDEVNGLITVTNLTADITIPVNKTLIWVDVQLKVRGNGTAILHTPRRRVTQTIMLNAYPNLGEDFVGWLDEDGNVLGTGAYLGFYPGRDITVTAVFTTRTLNGVFTVGADGNGNLRKAHFSGGNLWYDGGKFLFESEQYMSSPASSCDRDSDHISHFMWCGTAADATALTYDDDGAEELFTEADGFTVYGASGWYAPSNQDLMALIHTRKTSNGTASTVCGQADARWFKGRINTGGGTYVNGMFLIPDVFTWPESVTTAPEGKINLASAAFSSTSFSLDEFHTLEEAGLVFLPAAGHRDGSNGGDSSIGSYAVTDVNSMGYYWIANIPSEPYSEQFSFSNDAIFPSGQYWAMNVRYKAYSVRLMIDIAE